MIVIRSRTNADLDQCAAILCRVYAASGYPVEGVADPEKKLCSGDFEQVYVAERDGKILGHAAICAATEDDLAIPMWKQAHPDEHVATLGKLFTDPDQQGGGVATQLVEKAIEWSREAKARLVLFVLIKDQPAIRLYQRLGWVEFGTATYHYGDGEHMESICFASPDIQHRTFTLLIHPE